MCLPLNFGEIPDTNGETFGILLNDKMIERLTIHGQIRRKNLNSSGRLTWIEGLLSGGYGRIEGGQERARRGRQDGSRPP